MEGGLAGAVAYHFALPRLCTSDDMNENQRKRIYDKTCSLSFTVFPIVTGITCLVGSLLRQMSWLDMCEAIESTMISSLFYFFPGALLGYWLAGKVRSVTLKVIFAASCPLLPLLLMMTAAYVVCMSEDMTRNFHAFPAGKFVPMFLLPYFLGIAVYTVLIHRLYKKSPLNQCEYASK